MTASEDEVPSWVFRDPWETEEPDFSENLPHPFGGSSTAESRPQAPTGSTSSPPPSNVVQLFDEPPAPKLPSFPSIAIRGLTNYFLEAIAPITEAPIENLWLAHHVSMAALMGRDVRIAWGTGSLYPNLHGCILGKPGSAKKTGAIGFAHDLLIKPLLPTKQGPNEPESFVDYEGSITGEALVQMVADKAWWPPGTKKGQHPPSIVNRRRMLLVIPEFGSALEKIERGAAGSLIEKLNSAYDMRKLDNRTATNPNPASSDEATVCMLTSSTWGWLGDHLTPAHIASGLVSRILWVTGDERGEIPRVRPPDPRAETYYRWLAQEVHAKRRPLVIDSAADESYDHYYSRWKRRRQAKGEEAGGDLFCQGTARGDAFAWKLAMHFAFEEGQDSISFAHVQAAWAVVDYAEAIFEILLGKLRVRDAGQVEDRILTSAQRLVEGRTPAPTFTRYELFQRVKGRSGIPAAIFNPAFESLVKSGAIEIVNGDVTHGLTKRGTRFRLVPVRGV